MKSSRAVRARSMRIKPSVAAWHRFQKHIHLNIGGWDWYRHPPEKRQLLVVSAVGRIVSGLDLREPLHAHGVDLRDPMFEPSALHLIFDLAIPQGPFDCHELSFLEIPGKLREIAPGIDAVPFGAGFVVAFVVLPAFLGCDVEDGVLAAVLSGFGLCVLSEAADEDDFVEHGVWLRFFLGCPLSAVHACPTGVPSRPTPSATGQNLRKGTQTCCGAGVRTSQRRAADFGKESARPKGGGALSAAR